MLRPSPGAGYLRGVLAAWITGSLIGCGGGAVETTPPERLVATLLAERFTTGRLAGQTAWQLCTPIDTSALVARARCGIADSAAAALSDYGSLRSDSTPAALHAGALYGLRWHNLERSYLDGSIDALERAHRLSPRDARILNDLAVAYLELGEREQQLAPMLRALDVIERAMARDSTLPWVRFNRAVILERLYLAQSAARAWHEYLAIERHQGWRGEAEAHARRLGQVADTVSWAPLRRQPPARLDEAARSLVTRQVLRSPQNAREFSFALLGDWGLAAGRGDRVRAARLLALARAIGDAGASAGLDRSVWLAVRTIDLEKDPRALRRLQAAHAEFAKGFALFFAPEYEEAAASLARAGAALDSLGSPAASWASFYRAAAAMNLGEFLLADSLYRDAERAVSRDEPALLGKAVWARGVNQLRQGNYERAIGFYRDAIPHIARAREPENQGAISYLLSEALLLAGQTAPGRAEAYQGLRLLSAFRKSGFLNNHLTIVTLYAQDAGLEHAALALMDEAVEVSRSVGRADVIAWAFQARAREHHALGRPDAARVDLDEAMRWVARIDTGKGRDRVRADVMLIRGRILRDRDPAAARDTLSRVVATYRAIDIRMNLPAALVDAAQAAEAAGDLASARRYLADAVAEIESQQASYQSAALRATRAETVEDVFDALIRIELDGSRSASAFEYLERSRMAAWPRTARPTPALRGVGGRALMARIRAELPADMLFLSYALLPDRLVVWTASLDGWRQHTVRTSRDSVAELVSRFEQEMARPDIRAGDARTRLFNLLLRPVAAELEGKRRLTIVPDRELNRVPFAGLWDTAADGYVVERFQVRTIPNADFFLSARWRPAAAESTTLVVGNPSLDPRLASALRDLPGAAIEAGRVAGLYDHVRVLRGADAPRHAVLEHLSRASVFHFAGHAVFNNEQPELSYLALAAGDDGGILQAREIGKLGLSTLQVVVLSACSTLNPRPSRAGPNAGLAYSFLRAGAPATISTIWDVSDQSTVEVMVEFHRRLADSVPAAEALRLAQVAALRSSRPELRAPAAWAAFVYTGP